MKNLSDRKLSVLMQDRLVNGGGGGSLVVAKSCPALATPCTAVCQAPLSVGFPRQEYWSGLPFPSPLDLPNPGIEPMSPVSSAFPALKAVCGV